MKLIKIVRSARNLIIGIKHNRQREIITTLVAAAGEWMAEKYADLAAQNFARKPSAEID